MFFPNKHLFVHIPKTGGSSLEHAICKKYFEHTDNTQIEQRSYEKYTVHGHFNNMVNGEDGHPQCLGGCSATGQRASNIM